jgi:hypothetical protein
VLVHQYGRRRSAFLHGGGFGEERVALDRNLT